MRCVAVKKKRISKVEHCRKYFNSNTFGRDVKRFMTTTCSKAIVNCIDEANGAEEISNVFYEIPYEVQKRSDRFT